MSNSASLTKKSLSTSRVCTVSIPKPKQDVTIVSTSKTAASQILVLTPDQIAKLGLTQHINKVMDSQAKLKDTTAQAQPARKKSMRVSKITIINPQTRDANSKKVETAPCPSSAKPIISEMKSKLSNILMNASAKKESENTPNESILLEDGKKRKQSAEERQMPSKIIKVTDNNDVVILDRASLEQHDFEEKEGIKPELLFTDEDYKEEDEMKVEIDEELIPKEEEPLSPDDTKQKINVLSNEQISLPYTYIELLKSHTSDKNATSTPSRIYSANSDNLQSLDISEIEPSNLNEDVSESSDKNSYVASDDEEDGNSDVDDPEDEMTVIINDFESCELIKVSKDGTRRSLNVNNDKPQTPKANTPETATASRIVDLTSNKEASNKKNDETCKETDTSPKIILNSHISKLIRCNMMNILKATASGSNSISKNKTTYKVIKPSEVINISDNQGQAKKALETVPKGARTIMLRLDETSSGKKLVKIPGSFSMQQGRIISSNIKGALGKQSTLILHSEKLEPSTSTTVELNPDNQEETEEISKPAPKKRGRKKKSEMIARELMLQKNAEPEPEPEIELSKRGRKRKVVDYSALAEGDFETEEYEKKPKKIMEGGSNNIVEIDTTITCNSDDTINCEYSVQESSTLSDGIVKRKRGRPRKIKIEDVTEDNHANEEAEVKLDSNDETTTSDFNKTELSAEVPKRKRGRPRKNKIENVEADNCDNSDVAVTGDESILQTKDNEVHQTETSNKEQIADSELNNVQKSEVPKRKRGRPRKNPVDVLVAAQVNPSNSTEETVLEENVENKVTRTDTEADLNCKSEPYTHAQLAVDTTDAVTSTNEISASVADQIREEVRAASLKEVSSIDAKQVSATCSTDQMKTSIVTSASLKQTSVVDSVEVNSSSHLEKTFEIKTCKSEKIKQASLECAGKIVTDSEEGRQAVNLNVTKNNRENKDTDSEINEVQSKKNNIMEANPTGKSNNPDGATETATEIFCDASLPNDNSITNTDQESTENSEICIGVQRNSTVTSVKINTKNSSPIKLNNSGDSTQAGEKVINEQLEVNLIVEGTSEEKTTKAEINFHTTNTLKENLVDTVNLENLEDMDSSNNSDHKRIEKNEDHNISEMKTKQIPEKSDMCNQMSKDPLRNNLDVENCHDTVGKRKLENKNNASRANDQTTTITEVVKVCISKNVKDTKSTVVQDNNERCVIDPTIQEELAAESTNVAANTGPLTLKKNNSQKTDVFFQGLASKPTVKKKIVNCTTGKGSEHTPATTVTSTKQMINRIFEHITLSQQSEKVNSDTINKETDKDACSPLKSTETNPANLNKTPKKENQSINVAKRMLNKKQKLNNPAEELDDNLNSNENVVCAVCKEEVSKGNWPTHKLRYHNNLAWKEGGKPLDLKNQDLVMSILKDIYKKKKPLHCEKCGTAKKSVVGYLSHKSLCQKTSEEVSALKVECQCCDRSMLPVSMGAHLKYCRGVESQRDDTKVEFTEVKIENPPLEGKRKAAARAENLIMSLKEEGSIESDILDALRSRRAWCKNFDFRPTRFMKKYFCKEINKQGALKCLFDECSFQATELNLFINHLYQCSKKPGEGFTCKLCVLTFNTEEKICQHVLQSHADSVKAEESSDDNMEEYNNACDEDSDEDVERRLYRPLHMNKPNLLHGIKFLLKHRICPPTTNVVYPAAIEWTQKFCDQNFTTPNLFPNWRTTLRSWVKLDPMLITSYLPSLRYSACVSVAASKKYMDPFKVEHKWKRFMLFEAALSENGISTFFCGGPVFALAWVPTPHDQVGYEQILAVSTSSKTDKGYMLHEKYSESGLIQFWNCGPLLNNVPVTEAPKLEFCIAHEYGPIWCLEWCPSGCYDKQPLEEYEFFQRLGILAVGSANTNIYLYSVCFPMMNSGKILKPQPLLKLVLESVIEQGTNDLESHVTKISWSKASGHRFLVAGYANGMVAIYDLCTTSTLLTLGLDEDGIETIMPYRVFSAHNHAITALSLYHLNNGRRWIMTGSIDRSIKYWDLENPSVPISNFPKVIITDGVWLSHWLSSIQTVDDSCAYGLTPMLAHQPRNFESEATAIMHSNSRITSVTGSEWTNGFVDGSVMGEIKAFFPHQMFFSLDGDKTFSKKKAVLGYARLLEKALSVDERIQEENRRLQSLNTKTKQHIANKAKLNIEQIISSSSKPEPTNYRETEEKYGLVFCDMILDSIEEFAANNSCFVANNYSKLHPTRANIYPMQSVNKVSLNPNQGSFSYLAAGYQAGFVRVSCLHFVNKK